MKTKTFSVLLALILLSTISGNSQDNKPSETEAVFNVIVTSKSGTPRQGETIILVKKTGEQKFAGTTGADGKCTIRIPSGDKYTVYYKYFSDQVKYKEIDVPGAYTLVIDTLRARLGELDRIHEIVKRHPGDVDLHLLFQRPDGREMRLAVAVPYRVDPDDEFIEAVREWRP